MRIAPGPNHATFIVRTVPGLYSRNTYVGATNFSAIMASILDFTCETALPKSETACPATGNSIDTKNLFFSILCRAAFNAAYSHTGGQARELVRT